MRAIPRFLGILAHTTLLTAFAVSLSSCGEPPELAQQKADEFVAESQQLYDDYYAKAHNVIAHGKIDISPYYTFRDSVQKNCQQFMISLSQCKAQQEADDLFANAHDFTQENDDMRAKMQDLVKKSKGTELVKKYETSIKLVESGVKIEAQELLETYLLDNEGAYPEEVELVNATIADGSEKIKDIRKGLKGGNGKLSAANTEIDGVHASVLALLKQREDAYKGWVPPPPAPEQPEKILCTITTTPAVYEKLLVPLMQQYKNYTLVYVGEKTGNHCVADAQNKEGVVFRIVNPLNLQPALDNLTQGTCDAVIAFRNAFPEESYAQFEQQAAEDASDLNSVIVSGLAYSALVFKASELNAKKNVTTSGLEQELEGTTLYVGTADTLDKELFDTILKDKVLKSLSVEDPVAQGTQGADTLAAVAFSREEDAARELMVARTPNKENVYFLPTKGNIAAGRYTYNASTNALLNPMSNGNDEVRKFLAYVMSDNGQSVVRSAGFVSRDEFDENNPEIQRLHKLFKDKGYAIGRIISYDTFLFPKNDAHITKNPKVLNRKAEFSAFDSTIRSNFGHIADVLRNAKCHNEEGLIAVGIIGHASSEGGFSVNKPLSVNRAKYAAACIKEQVPVNMMLLDGMSSEVPVDSNDEESGRIRNRRATAYVLEVFEVGAKK